MIHEHPEHPEHPALPGRAVAGVTVRAGRHPRPSSRQLPRRPAWSCGWSAGTRPRPPAARTPAQPARTTRSRSPAGWAPWPTGCATGPRRSGTIRPSTPCDAGVARTPREPRRHRPVRHRNHPPGRGPRPRCDRHRPPGRLVHPRIADRGGRTAGADGSVARTITKITRADLIMIDDIGMLSAGQAPPKRLRIASSTPPTSAGGRFGAEAGPPSGCRRKRGGSQWRSGPHRNEYERAECGLRAGGSGLVLNWITLWNTVYLDPPRPVARRGLSGARRASCGSRPTAPPPQRARALLVPTPRPRRTRRALRDPDTSDDEEH